MVNLPPVLRLRYFDANGLPLAGGKLHSYQAGTTTPQATYIDSTGSTPNTNPIILDANGEASMWLDQALSYKFILTDSLDVPQWTEDNVVGLLSIGAVTTAAIQDGAVTTPKIADGAVTPEKLSGQLNGPYSLLNYGLLVSVAANALVITLTDGAGGPPTVLSPVRAAFRSTVSSSGVIIHRSIDAALTATVSSGSTLGSVSGQPNWIYVYLADDGTTRQIAFSASKTWDEGSLHAVVAEGGVGGADSKSTLYGDSDMTSATVRLIGRIRSTQVTAGVWMAAPSEISLFPFEQKVLRSEVWVNTATGFGSGGTKIRTYSNVQLSLGSAITYTADSTNGDYFTINEDGLYSLTAIDGSTAAVTTVGFSKNSTELTTSLTGIAISDIIIFNITIAGQYGHVTGIANLKAGDVIRMHTDGSQNVTAVDLVQVRIVKITD